MKRYIVEGECLPAWSAPISHAVVAGNHCYVSGQLSLAPDGSFVDGTAAEQAHRAFANVFAALRAAGFAPSDLVFVDIVFADLDDASDVNRVYVELFPEGARPARTISQAAALPYGGRVKIHGVAIRT